MTDIREQEMQNCIDSLTFGSRTEKTKKILGEVEGIIGVAIMFELIIRNINMIKI